jgi:uncharacterized membrane protein YbhN (UPF0104 family)
MFGSHFGYVIMKRNRLIFYTVIGVLHLLIFLFTLYMDSQRDNLQFLVDLQKVIWLLKYAMFILLVLFVTNFVLHMRDNKRHQRENVQLIQEMNILKAKLYDFQETGKKTAEPTPPKPS